MPTLKTVTLGCKVNQYETEYVRQGFERLGYRDALRGEAVDLCIVNTCVVTTESEAKSRKIIRRLAKLHPRAEIIVMGCYAARAADEAAALPQVGEVVADKRQLAAMLARRGLTDVPSGISYYSCRRRAYVKVQDGCRGRCAYCIIPTVRPYLESRPAEDVLGEIRRLVDRGHREIVLTGIHLGLYGTSNEATTETDGLASLLQRIMALGGDFRVRLSSIEAPEVSTQLLDVMAERSDRICPHLHLPLQSGSDAVLARMNRRWSVEPFIDRCRKIRERLDLPALTTDVIVGFPGETEADFEATCRVVEAVGFAKVHVFRFSPRPGTPAAAMPRQVTNRIVQQRAAALETVAQAVRERYFRSLLGRTLDVLVESPLPDAPGGWMLGTCQRHAQAATPADRDSIGRILQTKALRVENGVIWCSQTEPIAR